MITEISTQNFKSWQDTGKLQFAPLTGFFGANNSGKTSILQLLLLLKQTTESPLSPEEPLYFGNAESLVNLGDFDAVIHKHKQNLNLDISVSWTLPEQINIEGELTDVLSFSTSIGTKNKSLELNGFRYAVGKRDFEVERTWRGHTLKSHQVDLASFRCYGIVNPTDSLEEPFLHLQEAFENLFSRIRYLGPRRADPRHAIIAWAESHPEDIGRRGEKMISALLSSRVQTPLH